MDVIVDQVAEVVNIRSEQIEPPPALGAAPHTKSISAMGKVGSKVIILLDTDKVLSWGELDEKTNVADSA
jgi:purine-binding chemotaxis protein CheW